MADTVLIEGLVVETVVGVYDWEREVTRVPGRTDDVADALDYAAVSARVETCLQALRPQLLEHGAEVLAKALQDEFGITWLRLAIRKPGAVPTAQAVGVQIERGVR